MNDEQRLRLAAAERKRRIKTMRLCECTWPLDTYRNGSGHADTCPAHDAWKAER